MWPGAYQVCFSQSSYLARALLSSLLSPAETGLYRVLPLLGRDEEGLRDLHYLYYLRNITKSTDLFSDKNLSDSGLSFLILFLDTCWVFTWSSYEIIISFVCILPCLSWYLEMTYDKVCCAWSHTMWTAMSHLKAVKTSQTIQSGSNTPTPIQLSACHA